MLAEALVKPVARTRIAALIGHVRTSPILGAQGRPQRRSGLMESRLHGADRTSDDEGDLLHRVPLEVVEGKDGPMVDRQPSKRPRQRIAARERLARLEARVHDPVGPDQLAAAAGGRRALVGDPDEPDPAGTPQSMTCGMDKDRSQPGLEGRRVAKPRQVAPDHHECLLHNVVGIDTVASDRSNEAPGTLEMARDELGERVVVTPLGTLDESALVAVLGH